MSITLGTTRFDSVDYDEAADVLYLHVGDPSAAVDFDESPEGHALRFDAEGNLIGVTIVGAHELIRQNRPLVVTVPSHLEIDPAALETLLTSR